MIKRFIPLFAILFLIIILVQVSGAVIPPLNNSRCYELDLNKDFIINEKDQNIVKDFIGTICDSNDNECLAVDLDKNEIIDFEDLRILRNYNSTKCSPIQELFQCGNIELFYFDSNTEKPILNRDSYLFKNERVKWKILAYNSNGVRDIKDLFVSLDPTATGSNIKVVSCTKSDADTIDPDCNAKINNKELTSFNSSLMSYYNCKLTVNSTHGERYAHILMKSKNNNLTLRDNSEIFYLNPIINLTSSKKSINYVKTNEYYNDRMNDFFYSDLINVTELSEIITKDSRLFLTIDGSNFYENLTKLDCNADDLMDKKNIILYYIEKDNYTTLSDSRADTEGYIKLPKNSSSLFIAEDYNYISPNKDFKIKFKIKIPASCNGGRISPRIRIIGTDKSNPNIRYNLYIPIQIDIAKQLILTRITNITALSSNDSNSCLNNNCIIDKDRNYLYSGDSISYVVQVFSKTGAENITRVYVTADGYPLSMCTRDIKVYNTTQRFNCTLTINDSMYGMNMHGLKNIETFAELNTGGFAEIKTKIPIKKYYMNNINNITSNTSTINFKESLAGSTAYSDSFYITTKTEDNWNIPLVMFISGNDLTSNKNIICSGINNISSLNISYYAENYNYSTKNDPRSDYEGYIKITSNDQSIQPIMQNSGNYLKLDNKLKVKFKINIPNNCYGEFNSTNIFISSEPEFGSKNSIKEFTINLKVQANATCYKNIDCDDKNNKTFDECLNQGQINSYCNYTNVVCFADKECGINIFIGDNFCSNDNVFKILERFTCMNPGKKNSICQIKNESRLMDDCGLDSCKNISAKFCVDNKIYINQSCFDRGCSNKTCYENTFFNKSLIETCSDYCLNATCKLFTCKKDFDCSDNDPFTVDKCLNPGTIQSSCVYENKTCSTNIECGNITLGNYLCKDNSSYRTIKQPTCNNPETNQSFCSYVMNDTFIETCTLGCELGKCKQDLNAPEAIITYDLSTFDLKITGIDDIDQNITTNLRKNSCTTKGSSRICDREYFMSDYSNNTLLIKLNIIIQTNKLTTKFLDIKNNNKDYYPTDNKYTISKSNTNGFTQDISLKNYYTISSTFNPKKSNTTEIKINENRKIKTISKNGAYIIPLKTKKASLNYTL